MKKFHLTLTTFCFLPFLALLSFNSRAQTTLSVGDLSIIGFNANTPDNFTFVTWVPVANGTYIKFTDNGFLANSSANTANNARGGENFVIWQNTSGAAIAAGTVIKIEGVTASVGTAGGGSASGLNGISNAGDQIFAYQGIATSGANPDFTLNVNPTTFNGSILFGMGFQGSSSATTWLSTGTPTSNTSYLPTDLSVANGNVYLSASATRGEYTGSRSNQASIADYKAMVNNPANWTTAPMTGIITLNVTNFTTSSSTPSVSLSTSANAGTETGATVITLTATASAPVINAESVSVAVNGTGITAGDFILGNSTISIPAGGTSGSATFTVQDDVVVEGDETATITISNPSAGIILGTPISQNILITDNDVSLPEVNLSVSTNTASEAGATVVTVTATASAPVTSNQTVSLTVTGAGISASDYVLQAPTITILNGQTTGSVSLRIKNDAETEGSETAVLTISNPSSGISLGAATTQNISITDNICQPIIRKSSATSANGAEISAFDPVTNRVFSVAGTVVEYYTLSSGALLSSPATIATGFTAGANNILPNSIAVKDNIVAVSYAIVNPATNAQLPGVVAFYDASTTAYLSQVTVGFLPDMIIFSPDGNKILTANEGEPNSYGQGNSFDPEGSVSIIDVSAGVTSATVTTAGFSSFNSQIVSLKAAGVRITGPGATVAQDLEPEYIAFSTDGATAFITLQENNAIAKLDVATASITQILPLGLKNHNLAANGFDASDQDGGVNILNWPVFGMYQPDAISSFHVGGTNYFITANEGDSRAYTGFNEEVRVGAGAYNLDAMTFPNATTLKMNTNLGRLQLTSATGDTDGDGDFDQIHALGSRSFSIWSSNFTQIFDSGDQLEQITAAQNSASFNSDGTSSSFDGRSDNKGPEPEAVTTGVVNGIIYAFVGSERTGDVFVYDITNPAAPVFKQYIDHPQDLAVEGIIFVPASESPTGKALIITSAEVSRTVTVYEFSLIPNALATVNTTIVSTQSSITSFGNCAGLVAQVAQNGAAPINGTVTAKVFIEPMVLSNNGVPFVQRHYEISPAPNPIAATGRATLYFTQAEFDNFNADPASTLNLPVNAADAAGISNLLVIKYPGESSNGSGLPATYAGNPIEINPADADIIFNATAARWEVSFDVVGFSGFFVQTASTVLPVSLLGFTAQASGRNSLVSWKAATEINHALYEVQYSKDGINFITAGNQNPSGLPNQNYNFTHQDAASIAQKLFYRLKMISVNADVSYSDVEIVRFTATDLLISKIYPAPTTGLVNIVSKASPANPVTIMVYDLSGRMILRSKITNSTVETIDISNQSKGMYIFEASTADGKKEQFKIMKQ